MKVRISYGVELEEVPSMVADMVNQAAAELEQLADSLKSSAGMMSVDNSMMQNGAIQMLHHVRVSVSDVDATLNDAQSIMTGYVDAMEEQHNPSAPEPQVAPAAPVPPPSAPSVSDLEEAYSSVAEVPEDV